MSEALEEQVCVCFAFISAMTDDVTMVRSIARAGVLIASLEFKPEPFHRSKSWFTLLS